MADHGLRAGQGVQEMDSFVAIGMHLKRRGQPVPAIHLADPVAGLVFLEDLGDRTLQQAAAQGTARRNVQALYRRVVEALVAMSIEGLDGFDPAWCYQTPAYSRELILERECAYFEEHFLRGTAGLAVDSRALRGEFEALADLALKHAEPGFMHRDMQSRNVMLKDGRPVFIDFQGARIGPVQYDLASLLADPYVGLGPDAQERLLQHAFERLCERRALSADAFFDCYVHCALCRNLQILGAFGFLSRVKNKRGFTAYIPRALAGLEQRLAGRAGESFPTLRHVVGRARRRLRL
jgi:aminoglycoside/choline kinase family phosphotransferase